MSPVVEVTDLVKTYDGVNAVNGTSFTIEQGEVFSLLGPNGAGKSTTIEILEGHRQRTSGSVSVLGVDPTDADRSFRDRIGIVLQTSGIEDELTVREAIELYRSGYRNPRGANEVIELVGLGAKADERVSTLSGGQQRRIDLALGLVGNPEILFLDEPTTGFDPSARRESWELLASLRGLGTTILLTTHYMEEAEFLADRVAVIVGGKIVANGTPEELSSATSLTTIEFRTGADVSVPEIGASTRQVGRAVTIETSDPTKDLNTLTGWALREGVELGDLSVSRPSLEDVYLSLTDGGPGEMA